MRRFILILFLVSSLPIFSQSKEHAGSYEMSLGGEDHFETIKLTLNPNGTFLFHFYDNRKNGIPKERTKYGKGTWTSNKKLIFLKAEDSDVDATHELNLNNTKARYDTKSPRDKSNRDIKTSIRIYEVGEIFWLKGRTLIKNSSPRLKKEEPECCRTVEEVESYLNGKWKKKNPDDKKEYHYTFNNGQGTFGVFEKNEEGVLVNINKNTVDVKISETENGFKMEKNFDGLSIYSGIKYLDAIKLVLVRRDGKESELFRIKE